jgi:hypothetical protein
VGLVPFNQIACLDGSSRLRNLPIDPNSSVLADLLGQASPGNEARLLKKQIQSNRIGVLSYVLSLGLSPHLYFFFLSFLSLPD